MEAETKTSIKTCSIFDEEIFKTVTKGIQVSQLMNLKQACTTTGEDKTVLLQDLNISDRLFCSYCDVSFPDQLHQRQHYKLDWHRYNLKQHLANKKLVSEEKFVQIAENDDVSSISGSESDSDSELSSVTETDEVSDERVSHLMARRAKILFENENGNLISLHQCLIHNKKGDPPSEDQLVSLASNLPAQNSWMIIMLGGGHMAAAIFKGTEAIRHKTFHSYTVRAKQGGSQSSRDNSGKHFKSAGSNLRAHNEQTLTQNIQETLAAWAVEMAACQMIFFRAVGPFNRGVLFGGKNPPLNKADSRLRRVPFPTRRATYNEVQRVHSLLATITVYESPEMFRGSLISPRKPRKDQLIYDGNQSEKPASPRKGIDRAKPRPSPDRALPDIVTALAAIETSDSESGEDQQMTYNNEGITFNSSLQECENSMPKKIKKKKKKKEQLPEKEISMEIRNFRRKVFTACESGDTSLLLSALEEEVTDADLTEAVNQLNPEGLTLLQFCAQHSYKDIVWILLEKGASPCTKDKKAMTAYDFAPDKETRNAFRRFMGQFPDKYDYSKSHIPSALTDAVEQEQMERKRALRKAKRQKEKEKKIADEPRRQEEAEKKRFLELSDREKRALAAERRILAAAGKTGIVLTRCYLCALDITGKVPFTYETFQFCSMDCLKAHRKAKRVL